MLLGNHTRRAGGHYRGLGAATEAGRIPQDAPLLGVLPACEALATLSAILVGQRGSMVATAVR